MGKCVCENLCARGRCVCEGCGWGDEGGVRMLKGHEQCKSFGQRINFPIAKPLESGNLNLEAYKQAKCIKSVCGYVPAECV